MCNRHAVFAILTCFVGTFNIVFFQGFIPNTLEDLGLDESYVGYVYGSQSVTYLLACILLPYTCEESPRKLQFVVSILGMGVCMLMMGPSELLNLPNNEWIIIAGFPILGIF